ncbi:MAG: hypothetical protein ACO32I_01165 [Candidatus Limnocylindrus sp.]
MSSNSRPRGTANAAPATPAAPAAPAQPAAPPPANAVGVDTMLANAGFQPTDLGAFLALSQDKRDQVLNMIRGTAMSTPTTTPAPAAPAAPAPALVTVDPHAINGMIQSATSNAVNTAVDAVFHPDNVRKLADEMARVAKEDRPFYKDPLVLGIAGAVAAAGVGYVIYKSHQNSKSALALANANASAINALGITPMEGGGVRLLNVK